MKKDRFIPLAAGILAALVVWYVYPLFTNHAPAENSVTISAEQYQQAARTLADEITLISPTPPTTDSWIAQQIEFVPQSSLAYVTYHDTRNIFRLLAGASEMDGELHFRTVATFEAQGAGWRLIDGEDRAEGQKLISFVFNPETNAWENKEGQDNK